MEVEGGGERNGMEGIVVGIVNVGMEGNGGTLSCGIVGMLGMLLGSGGKVVGIDGRVGMLLGSGGKVVGIDGRVGCGRDGIVGNGGTLP